MECECISTNRWSKFVFLPSIVFIVLIPYFLHNLLCEGATWYQTHASAAKAAIDSLTRSLGLEWGAFGIRVCGIAPGPIADTPGMSKLSGGIEAEVLEEALGKRIPVQRLGRTNDVAFAAVFLCLNTSGFITGETLVVDGGAWLSSEPQIPREMVSDLSRRVEGKSRAIKPEMAKL